MEKGPFEMLLEADAALFAKDARIARLVALLREVEWAGRDDDYSEVMSACPICLAQKITITENGNEVTAIHLPSCRLAQEIGEGG